MSLYWFIAGAIIGGGLVYMVMTFAVVAPLFEKIEDLQEALKRVWIEYPKESEE